MGTKRIPQRDFARGKLFSRAKLVISPLLVLAMLIAFLTGTSDAVSDQGASADNPVLVNSPDEVPEGAVEDSASTYTDPNSQCATTRSWVLTQPGTEAVTHEEHKYSKMVPAVEGIAHQQFQKIIRIPGQKELKHTEYIFQRKVTTQKYVPGVGWHMGWVLDKVYYPKGEEPSHYADDPNWQICLERFINGENGEKEYLWHHYEVVREEVPPIPEAYYYQKTPGHYAVGNPPAPSDFMPADAVEVGPWVRTGVGAIIVIDQPFKAPTIEIRWYDGTPDGTLDKSEATWEPNNPGPGDGWAANSLIKYIPENQAAYPEYYSGNGGTSTNPADATWNQHPPANGPWTVIDTRTVTEREATPEVVTYYAWSDNLQCEEEPPTTTNPLPDVGGIDDEPTPPVSVPETETETPLPAPTPPTEVKDETATPDPGASTLPRTGSNTTNFLMTGLAMAVLGGALVVLGRRRLANGIG